MNVLGYSKWGNFKKVIEKTISSIESADIPISEHIADVGKMAQIGSNTRREI